MTELNEENKLLIEQMKKNVIQAFRDAHPGDSEDMHQERERNFAEFMDKSMKMVESMNELSEQDMAIMAKSMGMTMLNEVMNNFVKVMEAPIGSLDPSGFVTVSEEPKDTTKF